MKALDGTTRAPWRKVDEEHPGGTLTLECGHMICLEPGIPVRERYQCLYCAKLPPPPKRTPAEKRARKALLITDDAWPVLIAIARGEWPWKPGAGKILVTSALNRLRLAGYVIYDPDTAAARGHETQYVATTQGHAAAVHADWESWNASAELWALASERARK